MAGEQEGPRAKKLLKAIGIAVVSLLVVGGAVILGGMIVLVTA